MSEWDGKDRRKDNARHNNDHDVLTRIDANLSNFMRRFDDHAAEDVNNFTGINNKADKIEDRLSKVEKVMWTAIGGGALLAGILKFVVK